MSSSSIGFNSSGFKKAIYTALYRTRVFASALGIAAEDAPELREKLLKVARTGEAQLGELDMYGQRYMIDFEMETEAGKAVVRSGWIILHDENTPRLTTCYVKKRKK